MTDRYAVLGHPIAHSKSPRIHTLFALQTGEDISYEARLVPLGGFVQEISTIATWGFKGANVTVPFKEEAFGLATRRTPRAERAGAANTLVFEAGGVVIGDNTDGAGLLRDLTVNRGWPLADRRILLLGAGGAAKGVIEPLLAACPSQLVVANRTPEKALALAHVFSDLGPVRGVGLTQLAGESFDLVINATSASLSGELPALPPGVFGMGSAAYDMMYGKGETPFLAYAREQGAARRCDGFGMLLEQAAEAFLLWRGIRPRTAPVLAELRSELG